MVGFSELTEKDLNKIRQIVQSEVNAIKQDITKVELRLIEKIRESENRLQTQFNQSLDNRTNSIMIIFAVVSMGFFLLFGCILLVGALRNRQPNKKLIILMVVSLAGVMLCRVPSLNAQKDRFGDIICRSLTVVNEYDKEMIVLKANGDGKSLTFLGYNGTEVLLESHERSTRGLTIFDTVLDKEAIILKHQGYADPKSEDFLQIGAARGRGTLIDSHSVDTHDLQITDWEGYPTVRIKGESGYAERGIIIYKPSSLDPAIELLARFTYEKAH